MATGDRLQEYRKTRDFRSAGEPRGGDGGGRAAGEAPHFVIHKHDESTLHYDSCPEVAADG